MVVIFNIKLRLIDHEQQIIVAYNVHHVIVFVSLLGLNKFALVRFGYLLSSLLALQIPLEA